MSKALSTYPEAIRRTVIDRRLKGSGRGNGYHAARDAAIKLGISIPNAATGKPGTVVKRKRRKNNQEEE